MQIIRILAIILIYTGDIDRAFICVRFCLRLILDRTNRKSTRPAQPILGAFMIALSLGDSASVVVPKILVHQGKHWEQVRDALH